MPAIFPTPLPEELVYSVAARYGDMMGLESRRTLTLALFGAVEVSPGFELPGYVGRLLACLPPGHSYTADELLERHTALPYYRAFLDPDRAARLADAMREGSPESAARIPALLGPSRSALPAVERLRFCDACAAEDWVAHGTSYWRRVHQLPGVVACPTHRVPLFDSSVDRRARRETPKFVSLARALADGGAVRYALPAGRLALAADVAADSLWLLQRPADVARAGLATAQARWDRVKIWLNAAGFQLGRGFRLRPAQVVAAVEAALGADVLSLLCRDAASRVDPTSDPVGDDAPTAPGTEPPGVNVWVANMMRRRLYAEYPLLYLALLRSLGVSAEQFFTMRPDDDASTMLEATAEARCVNPVCKASRPPTRRVVDGGGPRAGRHPRVEVVCPACGYHYTAPADNDCAATRRVVTPGPLWEARLRALIDAGATGDAIVKALGLTLVTVQGLAHQLDMWHPRWSARARERARRVCEAAAGRAREHAAAAIAARDAYRTHWLALRAAHPDAGRAELTRRGHPVHAHLYRYDRNWLDANVPPVLPPRRSRTPPNWAERDDSFLPRVEAAVADIRSRPGRPVQVTTTAVLRALQGARWCRGWLPNMPRTRAMLERSVENGDAFVRRVIVYHAVQAASGREPLTPSALRDRAAPGRRQRVACRQFIEDAARAVTAHVECGVALPAAWREILAVSPRRVPLQAEPGGDACPPPRSAPA